ncbi:MAG TPA: enoyl-CoA hydratase/isomerase family protein [Gemmatimonadales bacterium]|nr:enoyl-CoA hydratase/isomerase family protein [Gemmatimonadales bacterium]
MTTIEFDAPPANALSGSLQEALANALTEAGSSRSCKTIVLRSAGTRFFCAGADISEFRQLRNSPEMDDRHHERADQLHAALLDCPVPTVCSIQGLALGAGFLLAALSDICIASTRAEFALPELSSGMVGGGLYLARVLPPPAVRYLYFTSRRLSAEDAHRWGFVHVIASPDALEETTRQVAREIASKPRAALAAARLALRNLDASFKEAARAELYLGRWVQRDDEVQQKLAEFEERFTKP